MLQITIQRYFIKGSALVNSYNVLCWPELQPVIWSPVWENIIKHATTLMLITHLIISGINTLAY